MKFNLLILLASAFFATPLRAQVIIGNNNTTPRPFSLLEMETTYHTGGLRLPQLTTQQRNDLNLSSSDLAANGLVVYNTESQCIEFWNDGVWVSMCSGSAQITLEDRGRGIVDLDITMAPFPIGGGSLTLTPHGTHDCYTKTPPYTAEILFGGEYAKVVTINSTTGEFSLTIDENLFVARMAILRVTDKCTEKYSDFLLIQEGYGIPAKPGAISGQKFASADGLGVSYSIAAVPGATSYTWTLPVGWEGSSDSLRVFTKPGTLAENGVISVTANNACGSSEANTFPVTVVHGCGAQISDTEWREFLCYNLGADYTANPFEPSSALNGDYYQWGSKTSAATRDEIKAPWNNPAPEGYYGASGTDFELISTNRSYADPCPPGFRVPNRDEMSSVFNTAYNTRTDRPDASAWVDSPGSEFAWTGILFGDALFLPAAGNCSSSYGDLSNRGFGGYYWTNTLHDAANAYYASISSAGANTNSFDLYTNGYSIRCIKE